MRSTYSKASPPVPLLLLIPLLPQSFSLRFFGYGTSVSVPPKASVPPFIHRLAVWKIALHRSSAEIGQFLDFCYTFTLSEQCIHHLTDCCLICTGCNQQFPHLERCMENSSVNWLSCICSVSSSVPCGGFKCASVTASISCYAIWSESYAGFFLVLPCYPSWYSFRFNLI